VFYFNFYSGKVKIVPKDLSLLTPLALAHFTTQKGWLCGRSLYLCTEGFSRADVQRLSTYLIDRYSIKCTVHKRAGNYHIYILANSLENFKNLISPYKLKMPYPYETENNLKLFEGSHKATTGRASFSFNTKRPGSVAFLSQNSNFSLPLGRRSLGRDARVLALRRKYFSTKDNPNSCVPVLKYDNADLLKLRPAL